MVCRKLVVSHRLGGVDFEKAVGADGVRGMIENLDASKLLIGLGLWFAKKMHRFW